MEGVKGREVYLRGESFEDGGLLVCVSVCVCGGGGLRKVWKGVT